MKRPPRLPKAALQWVLPESALSQSILGDLEEEYRERTRLWYWLEAARLSARYLVRRRKRRSEGDTSMQTFASDVRYTVTSFLRKPGFTLVVVLTLALGIGANTAIFSILDAILLRPFPLPDIDALVQLFGTVPQRGEDRDGASPADLLDFRSQANAFEHIVGMEWWDVAVAGREEPERVQGYLVSSEFFQALGVRPAHGRAFSPEEGERGRHRVAVMSERLWWRRYAGDPKIVGATILLDGEPHTVVGIAPSGFNYPVGSDIWAPLTFDPKRAAERGSHYLEVIARRRPGVSVEAAEAELSVIAERLEKRFPDTNRGRGVRLMPLARAVVDFGAPAFLLIWQATVLFVLLIACINVANLLLARGNDRQKELAIRHALGASRGRVLRFLFTESLLLSLIGAALSVAFAWVAMRLIRVNMPPEIARFIMGWERIDLDGRVLAVTGAFAVLTATAFGLLPAWQSSRPDLALTLKEGGRSAAPGGGRGRARSALVVAEIATALMLLVASGLTAQGTFRLLYGDQGYDPDKLMTMSISVPESRYQDPEARRGFFRDLVARVAGLPEVESAAAVSHLPSSGSNSSSIVTREGDESTPSADRPLVDWRVITPDYFATMRIPLIAGRTLMNGDRADGARVIVVSEAMAKRLWPGVEPLGRRLKLGTSPDDPWWTVVGIVGDVTHDWFLQGVRPTLYRASEQAPRYSMALTIRTRGEPTNVVPAVKSELAALDPLQPMYEVRTQRKVLSDKLMGLQYATVLMAVFGGLALLLSAVGVYAVMSYAVSRRTHEIGVRVALGAARRDVLRVTVGHALKLASLGVLFGLALATALGKIMSSALFGTIRLDAGTFVVFAMVLAGLLASYIPARRALAIDPILALRVE